MRGLTLLVLLISVEAFGATTYYVDYAGGSDSANGTSTGTPWKHCPGDPGATDTSASVTLSAGDNVVFKGGVVYYATNSAGGTKNPGLVFSFSGSTNNVITYDGTGNTWGTGKAVIDCQYSNTVSCISLADNVSHLRIDGFELRNAGGYSDDDPLTAAYTAGTQTNTSYSPGIGINAGENFFFNQNGRNTNITVANCYIHRMGNWRNGLGWDTTYVQAGHGMFFRDPQGLVITNCEVTDTSMTVMGALWKRGGGQCDYH